MSINFIYVYVYLYIHIHIYMYMYIYAPILPLLLPHCFCARTKQPQSLICDSSFFLSAPHYGIHLLNFHGRNLQYHLYRRPRGRAKTISSFPCSSPLSAISARSRGRTPTLYSESSFMSYSCTVCMYVSMYVRVSLYFIDIILDIALIHHLPKLEKWTRLGPASD